MKKYYRIYLLLLMLIFGFTIQTFAQGVKGFVTDQDTGEGLTGAVIYLENSNYHTIVNLDGSYHLKNIPAGNYSLVCQFTGFEKFNREVSLQGTEEVKLDIALKVESGILSDVVVVAKADQESDLGVRKLEQSSNQLMNIISARSIQISPDITVANVLQRVSGVSLERSSNGDGRYAVLRGMDKRYNYTLINGIKIPSPDPYNRYVPLDIFPSDLLQRLEVSKALTPDMEGDAIGGVVNMVMKDAPEERLIQVNLGTGYGQLFFDRSFKGFNKNDISIQAPVDKYGSDYQATPKDFPWLKFNNQTASPNILGNLSLGDRFFNQKLGVLFAASYQNTYRGSNGYFYKTTIDASNNPRFTELLVREYSTQQIRTGLNLKLDFKLNENNTFRMYNVLLSMDELQTRYTRDSTYKNTNVRPALADIDLLTRSRYQKQSIYNSTLQGEHYFADRQLFLNWSLVYSLASNKVPDLTEQDIKSSAEGLRYQNTDRIWQRNTDEDKTAYLNLSYKPQWRIKNLELSAGGLFRLKDRNNSFLSYQLRASGNTAIDPNNIDTEPYSVFNPQGIFVGANNYTAKENIIAGYFKFQFDARKFHILGGARIENTNQSYETSLPKTEPGRTGKQSYTDILPSLHVKYALDDRQNIRFSYFSSISRPSFFEITPYNIGGGVTETFSEAGNPYLKRTSAMNFDLRYEYFGKGNDQFFAGVFYKKIQDPIEYGLVKVPNSVATVYQPNNFGEAINYGFEWVGVKYLGSWGISTNYTFTISEITTPKIRNVITATGITSETVNQTRPLQGQSRHVANVSLFYKNVKSGFDVQLAWVFTGRRIVQVDQFVGLDYWQRDQSQLDFSIEKRFFKSFTLYAKVQNILNTPYQVDILSNYPYSSSDYPYPYQEQGNRINVINNTYGAYYLLGLRYKLQKP